MRRKVREKRGQKTGKKIKIRWMRRRKRQKSKKKKSQSVTLAFRQPVAFKRTPTLLTTHRPTVTFDLHNNGNEQNRLVKRAYRRCNRISTGTFQLYRTANWSGKFSCSCEGAVSENYTADWCP